MAFSRIFKQSQDRTYVKEDKTDVDEEFDNPWRNVNWDRKHDMLENLKEFPLSNPQLKHLRLLMCGPIGAGKSSFGNSVNSVFQHRITNKANMSTSSATSCTIAYRGYKIKNENSGTLPFMFYDTMGLEIHEDDGILPEDVINALCGHVPNGYKFNPHHHLHPEDPDYISKPLLEEKAHCLIFVVSGNSISQISNETIAKIKKIFKEANELGIPQVVVMTMIDKICPLVKKDLKNVYMSKKIKEKMLVCSDNLSIPMTCIFPVKNYHEETETNDDIDVLLLSAMEQIVHFANDFTEEL